MRYTDEHATPLGRVLLAADDEGLTGLWFMEGERYLADGLSPDAAPHASPFFDDAKRWLDVYFTGRDPGFTPRLHLTGSPFRVRVGELMLEIPYGRTTTYGDIARRIAAERGLAHMSAQAVGGAVGKNPISLIVPCHRVVGTGGSLTGYGGGIRRKEALLRLEGGYEDGSYIPKKGTAL